MENLTEFIGNNIFWVSLWFVVLILLLWNFFGNIFTGITAIDPMDVTRRINHDNAVIVDIRSSTEFDSGHIINALNIPDAEMSERKKELDKFKKKPIIFYCQNGSTSAQAVRKLKANGFEDVSSMKGGILTWQRATLPLSYGSN